MTVLRLKLIKKQQHARAEAHKASEEAKKSTMAQLEATRNLLETFEGILSIFLLFYQTIVKTLTKWLFILVQNCYANSALSAY